MAATLGNLAAKSLHNCPPNPLEEIELDLRNSKETRSLVPRFAGFRENGQEAARP